MFEAAAFTEQLAQLRKSQSSIKALSDYTREHAAHAEAIAGILHTELQRAEAPRIACIVYYMNEVMQSSRATLGSRFVEAFAPHLKTAASRLAKLRDSHASESMARVLDVLRTRKVLSSHAVDTLARVLQPRGDAPATGAADVRSPNTRKRPRPPRSPRTPPGSPPPENYFARPPASPTMAPMDDDGVIGVDDSAAHGDQLPWSRGRVGGGAAAVASGPTSTAPAAGSASADAPPGSSVHLTGAAGPSPAGISALHALVQPVAAAAAAQVGHLPLLRRLTATQAEQVMTEVQVQGKAALLALVGRASEGVVAPRPVPARRASQVARVPVSAVADIRRQRERLEKQLDAQAEVLQELEQQLQRAVREASGDDGGGVGEAEAPADADALAVDAELERTRELGVQVAARIEALRREREELAAAEARRLQREAEERERQQREAREREAREREAREREAREREARQREAQERERRDREARESERRRLAVQQGYGAGRAEEYSRAYAPPAPPRDDSLARADVLLASMLASMGPPAVPVAPPPAPPLSQPRQSVAPGPPPQSRSYGHTHAREAPPPYASSHGRVSVPQVPGRYEQRAHEGLPPPPPPPTGDWYRHDHGQRSLDAHAPSPYYQESRSPDPRYQALGPPGYPPPAQGYHSSGRGEDWGPARQGYPGAYGHGQGRSQWG